MKANKVNLLTTYYSFKDVYSLVKDLSWKVSSFEKRFPLPEAMTDQELKDVTAGYIALGSKVSELVEMWEKAHKEK